VTLPALGASADAAQAAPRDATKAGAGPLRIMVVEDNPDTAESFGLLLRLSGHDVRVMPRAVDALRLLEEFVADVAFLDIGLPGMDGFELARRLRTDPRVQGMVLVALTGYGRDEDRDEARRAGFDHHMTKPVDIDQLLALLNAIAPAARPARVVRRRSTSRAVTLLVRLRAGAFGLGERAFCGGLRGLGCGGSRQTRSASALALAGLRLRGPELRFDAMPLRSPAGGLRLAALALARSAASAAARPRPAALVLAGRYPTQRRRGTSIRDGSRIDGFEAGRIAVGRQRARRIGLEAAGGGQRRERRRHAAEDRFVRAVARLLQDAASALPQRCERVAIRGHRLAVAFADALRRREQLVERVARLPPELIDRPRRRGRSAQRGQLRRACRVTVGAERRRQPLRSATSGRAVPGRAPRGSVRMRSCSRVATQFASGHTAPRRRDARARP
jgi:CheY-like chemotaxis protein